MVLVLMKVIKNFHVNAALIIVVVILLEKGLDGE
jgi:hypothetical protein